MLRAPTIRKQAEILRTAAAQEDDPLLIPVRTAGSREPLFCLGGKGGTPIRFRALLQQIDERRPVYYFRSPGLRQGERTIEVVEEIAALYLTALRQVQPHGPFYLLGESGGGLVAYEMAQQLTRAGEKIGLLGMLDTYIPSYRNRRSSFGTLLRKHTQTLTSGGIQGLRNYTAYYSGLLAFKLRRFLDSIRKRWQSIRHAEALERYARIERANVRASRAYILRPFPGTLHLFHAVLQARYEGNVPANGWADVGVKELVVHPLNCYHGNVLFEPFVSEVARILNESLK
jgi:thioesterase domain-containing protein